MTDLPLSSLFAKQQEHHCIFKKKKKKDQCQGVERTEDGLKHLYIYVFYRNKTKSLYTPRRTSFRELCKILHAQWGLQQWKQEHLGTYFDTWAGGVIGKAENFSAVPVFLPDYAFSFGERLPSQD